MTPDEFRAVQRSATKQAWATRHQIARRLRHDNLTDEQINQLTRKELTR
jgi:hypothetical protein